MLRIFLGCIIGFPAVLYVFIRLYYRKHHYSKYSEINNFNLAVHIIKIIMFFGFIRTKVYGIENLPQKGGYIMYPNHQGKYDTLGIMYGHPTPCSVVIDEKRSHFVFVDPFITITDSLRMDKTSMKSQLQTILEVSRRVSAGQRYIIFPEGGYESNGNHLQTFLPGSFKCALKAKCPIVPTVIIDSYKVFNTRSIKPVTTKIFFLPPICFEEYSNMHTTEIAQLVQGRIAEKLNTELASPNSN